MLFNHCNTWLPTYLAYHLGYDSIIIDNVNEYQDGSATVWMPCNNEHTLSALREVSHQLWIETFNKYPQHGLRTREGHGTMGVDYLAWEVKK